jgi:His Kinase A (phospho-acceptor) domain
VIQPVSPATPTPLNLPLSQILSRAEASLCPAQSTSISQAQHQWQAAIAALNQLLGDTQPSLDSSLEPVNSNPCPSTGNRQGLILTGPVPVITCPELTVGLHSWVFSQQTPHHPLLPAVARQSSQPYLAEPTNIPLLLGDPVGHEQFCLLLTSQFSLVMVLSESTSPASGTDSKGATFQFSFSPDVVDQCYQNLRCRLSLTRPQLVATLDHLVSVYPPMPPDYPTLLRFSHQVLQAATQITHPLPEIRSSQTVPPHPLDVAAPTLKRKPAAAAGFAQAESSMASGLESGLDLELLQAIAHEVRTPLATIKTLTQLLLKRMDLPSEVLHRLEAIYRECAEQIDRFSLIFRAAELETSTCPAPMPAMASVSLADIFTEGIPRWQKQASRRHLTLELLLPNQLPAVKSDPTLLDQVLTGLIEHTTHRLPMGSHIQIEVTLAGHQLKLQVRSPNPTAPATPAHSKSSPLKSVGQVLMVQPETGNLSLSLPVTKNLFQVLGGKLTVRQRAEQEEILTLFLPLGGN